MTDRLEVHERILDAVADPKRFGTMLDQGVTLEPAGSDNLWRCHGYADLVAVMKAVYESGVRTVVDQWYLVRERMLLVSRIFRPAGRMAALPGPVDGQTMWRIFTLHHGRIVHISDFGNEDDAFKALLGDRWPVARANL